MTVFYYRVFFGAGQSKIKSIESFRTKTYIKNNAV